MMIIRDALKTMIGERNFERTPTGRSISQKAISSLDAAINDQKNYNVDAIKCTNCCIIMSSILPTKTCVNCGGIRMTTNIQKGDML